MQGDFLQVGVFSIGPTAFALETGEELQLQAAFAPSAASAETHSLWLTCDNGSIETYQLTGIGDLPCSLLLCEWNAVYILTKEVECVVRNMACGVLFVGSWHPNCCCSSFVTSNTLEV